MLETVGYYGVCAAWVRLSALCFFGGVVTQGLLRGTLGWSMGWAFSPLNP